MKKLTLMVAPMLVLGAFVVMPAMASAATTEYGTEAGGVFTPFAKATNVSIKKTTGSGNFMVKTEKGFDEFECTGFTGTASLKNVGGVGKGSSELRYTGCKLVGGVLGGCEINTAGSSMGTIVGLVSYEVVDPEAVKLATHGGFEVEVPGTAAGCPEGSFGDIFGTITGIQSPKSRILLFEKATGMNVFGSASLITMSQETITTVGGKAVVIG